MDSQSRKAEREHKHQVAKKYLDANGLDAVLLSRRCNFSWYTCGARNYVGTACDAGNSLLLVDRDRAHIITTNIEAVRLHKEELAGTGFDFLEYPYFDAAQRAAVLARATAGKRLATDAPVAGLNAPPLADDFNRLRWTLTDSEILRYRQVCADTISAIEFVARDAQPGNTEYELAAMASGALLSMGLLPWVLLVAADERLEHFRHPLPTDQVMTRRFMLVTCAERDGLICACTRLAHFGPLPAELEAKHQAVTTVDAAMISATRPGAKLGDIYAVSQAAYEATGYRDQWRLHHQGGPCGYLPREAIAGPGDATAALAGQAFAWNPSITGTKSEDTMVCTERGPEVLGGPSTWPQIQAEWKGFKINRPAILVR